MLPPRPPFFIPSCAAACTAMFAPASLAVGPADMSFCCAALPPPEDEQPTSIAALSAAAHIEIFVIRIAFPFPKVRSERDTHPRASRQPVMLPCMGANATWKARKIASYTEKSSKSIAYDKISSNLY